jgi:hypothetical protein
MREGSQAEFAAIVLVTVIVSAVVLLIWSLTLRYKRRELQHKERLAAIEKGAPVPNAIDVQRHAPWTPRMYLLRGMMWLFGGIGLLIFLVAVFAASHRPRTASERAWDAQHLRSAGASDELVRQALNDSSPPRVVDPSFSLIGLIPIGVGLAYLITYRSEAKSIATQVQRE